MEKIKFFFLSFKVAVCIKFEWMLTLPHRIYRICKSKKTTLRMRHRFSFIYVQVLLSQQHEIRKWILFKKSLFRNFTYLWYRKGDTVDLVIKFPEFKIHSIGMANGRSQKFIYLMQKVIAWWPVTITSRWSNKY